MVPVYVNCSNTDTQPWSTRCSSWDGSSDVPTVLEHIFKMFWEYPSQIPEMCSRFLAAKKFKLRLNHLHLTLNLCLLIMGTSAKGGSFLLSTYIYGPCNYTSNLPSAFSASEKTNSHYPQTWKDPSLATSWWISSTPCPVQPRPSDNMMAKTAHSILAVTLQLFYIVAAKPALLFCAKVNDRKYPICFLNYFR